MIFNNQSHGGGRLMSLELELPTKKGIVQTLNIERK